nr:MAG TPA: hypothetical protein [Caudoviricetes sp.]
MIFTKYKLPFPAIQSLVSKKIKPQDAGLCSSV